MQKISGVQIKDEIIKKLKQEPTPKKVLASVLVGDDPASLFFLKLKEKTAGELGVRFQLYKFPAEINNNDLEKEVVKIAEDELVGGIIVQLPLPQHINRQSILNVIPLEKDIDGLGIEYLGSLRAGNNLVLPPVVEVVKEILERFNFNLKEKKVAVVGLGFLVGEPIANWLKGKSKELYLLYQGSDFSVLKQADLVISGAGEPGLIKPAMLKPEVNVIDFGYGQDENGKPAGDFDDSEIDFDSGFYTPTPAGTGPILVAKIFENFYKLCHGK